VEDETGAFDATQCTLRRSKTISGPDTDSCDFLRENDPPRLGARLGPRRRGAESCPMSRVLVPIDPRTLLRRVAATEGKVSGRPATARRRVTKTAKEVLVVASATWRTMPATPLVQKACSTTARIMKHRHLVDGVGYTPAAVEDILDRGKPSDWAALRDIVVAEPQGVVAQAVLDVCRSTYMYGTSALWSALIAALRHENDYLAERPAPPR
jgi:hypothetical protein